jgi:hypothetical protein
METVLSPAWQSVGVGPNQPFAGNFSRVFQAGRNQEVFSV